MKWICCIIIQIHLSFLLLGCLEQEGDTSYFDQAEYYFSTGQFNQAKTLYQQYIDEKEHGSKRYQAWNRLLSIRVDIYGDVQGGLDILKAMQMEFDREKDKILDINASMAVMYERLGQPRESRRIWKKNKDLAVSMRNKKEAALFMSKKGMQLREFEKVREDLKDFSECSGEIDADLCSRIQYTLGKSYYMQTDLTRAGEILSRAYRLDAGKEYKSRAGLLLAEVLLDQEEIDEAKALLKELLDIHPNPGAIEVRLKNLTSSQDQSDFSR